MPLLVVCGCSFSAKVDALPGKHWSEILAEKMGATLINYARQGISNAAIRLQMNEAMKQNPNWVLVGATTEDRTEFPVVPFFKDGAGPNHSATQNNRNGYKRELGLKNLNYRVDGDHTMISETLFSIIDNNNHDYRKGKVDEDVRMAFGSYAAFMYDAHWKRQTDRWILNSGLWELHDRKINFLHNPWINAGPLEFDVPKWFSDRYFVSWQLGFGRLCSDYPFEGADPGFHTSFEGQEVLANRYYDYIQRIENANTNG